MAAASPRSSRGTTRCSRAWSRRSGPTRAYGPCWLAGSVGRGAADAGSDLDLVVTVVDLAAFAEPAVWALLDPVITLPIPGCRGASRSPPARGCASTWCWRRPRTSPASAYTRRVRVLDRDGLEPPARGRAGRPRRRPDAGRRSSSSCGSRRSSPPPSSRARTGCSVRSAVAALPPDALRPARRVEPSDAGDGRQAVESAGCAEPTRPPRSLPPTRGRPGRAWWRR